MTSIQSLLEQPASVALGWTLLHFLWQGTVAGLVWGACNFLLRDARASTRYGAGCLFLALMLVLPAVTFAILVAQPTSLPASGHWSAVPASAPIAAIRNSAPAGLQPGIQDLLAPMLPWIVALWIAGVALLSIRWIGAWTYMRRLRRSGSLPVLPEWERTLRDLKRRAAVSAPVRLAVQAATKAPCVIGWLRPVILMPAALTGLDLQAIEALLAHELAHIRRHDYLVNLLQTTVDTLLFYHPAVWAISRQVRIERENCCDDIAADICGDRAIYARALVDLEQMRAPDVGFAMSAAGGSLIDRIQRLLGHRPASGRTAPAWSSALAGLAIVIGLLAATHPSVKAGEPPTPQPSAPQPAAPLPAPAPRPTVPATSSDESAAPEPDDPAPPPATDFLSGIVAAGFHNLTVDELIQLKIHGVTPQFAAAVKQAGYAKVSAEELVQLAIHGVDIDYMNGLKRGGLNSLSIDDMVNLRIHGVTPDFMAEMKAAGYGGLSADEYTQLRIHGVDPEFVRHLKDHGFQHLTLDELLRLKRAGL